jgi:hypothetical protein
VTLKVHAADSISLTDIADVTPNLNVQVADASAVTEAVDIRIV